MRFKEAYMSESDKTSQFWNDLKSGHFASMVKESSKGQALSNSQEVYNIMKPMFAREDDVERVYLIFLDARNKILAIENLFSGSITSSTIYSREIVKRIIQLKATAVVLVHNHPSGETAPSTEDKAITIKVAIAAGSIDVLLHDHIIIGDGYQSMADTGLIRKFSEIFESCKIGIEPGR